MSNSVTAKQTKLVTIVLTEPTAKKLVGILDNVYWDNDGKDTDLSGVHDSLQEALDYESVEYVVDTDVQSIKLNTSKFDE